MVESVEVLLRLLDGGVSCFSLPLPLSLSSLHRRIEELHGVPCTLQRLHVDGRPLSEGVGSALSSPVPSPFLCVSLSLALLGGKGGFGTLLRATTSQVGAKRTTDFLAMRDLHGRRRRHVEQERELEEWKRREEGKSDEDKRRERREAQLKISDVNKGRSSAHSQPCRFGRQCKYQATTCRRQHPEDGTVGGDDAKEAEGRAAKRQRGGSAAPVGAFVGSWQAQVVDEEEMREDLQLGLRHREGRRHQRFDPPSDDSQGEEEEGKEGEDGLEESKDAPSERLLLGLGAGPKTAVRVSAEVREETKEGSSASSDGWEEERKDGLGAALTVPSTDPSTSFPVRPPSSATFSSPPSLSPSPFSSSLSVDFPPVDLSLHSSAASLESLGLSHLSAELRRRGLKTGGRLAERAERLFFCRDKAMDDIPWRMRATNTNTTTTPHTAA